MIFAADAASSATSISEVVSIAIAAIGILAIAAAYFKHLFDKSDRDYDKDSIRRLTTNNEILEADNKRLEKQVADLSGQLKGLQNTVTAAPAIAKLAKQTVRQHKQATELQMRIIEHLDKLIEKRTA